MNKDSGVIEIFSERLKDLMSEKGLNIKDFSKGVGIPRSTISDWLLMKRRPIIDNLPKIALFFGVSTDYLLGLENYKTA